MTKVEIYTSPLCGFCAKAKQLLDKKGIDYEEIDVFMAKGARAQMIERTGGRTSVPQIFIDGEAVGGCDDLYELEFDGELDSKLSLAS